MAEGEPTRIMIGVNESTIKGYPHASISSRGAFDWTLQKIVRSNTSGFKLLFLHVQVPDEDGQALSPTRVWCKSMPNCLCCGYGWKWISIFFWCLSWGCGTGPSHWCISVYRVICKFSFSGLCLFVCWFMLSVLRFCFETAYAGL